jgi:hypothetical protein
MKNGIRVVLGLAATLGVTTTATAANPSITLQASPTVVAYGATTTLSGTVANASGKQTADVLAQECGSTTMKPLTSVTPNTSGGYTYAAHPRTNTAYEGKYKSATSPAVAVKVRPLLSLRRLARGRFAVTLLAAQSFAGHRVAFQRYAASTGRWLTLKTVTLTAGATVTTPLPSTLTSAASFRVRIKSRPKVRALLTQAQAGSCYAATRSNVIRA